MCPLTSKRWQVICRGKLEGVVCAPTAETAKEKAADIHGVPADEIEVVELHLPTCDDGLEDVAMLIHHRRRKEKEDEENEKRKTSKHTLPTGSA